MVSVAARAAGSVGVCVDIGWVGVALWDICPNCATPPRQPPYHHPNSQQYPVWAVSSRGGGG